jgi:hypothetical protein
MNQNLTKYFIFLDNSGSMDCYYKNMKTNLYNMVSHLKINPTILTFDDTTTELSGSSFVEKLDNYKRPKGYTLMGGVVEKFLQYLTDEATFHQKIYILFITDGDVHDLDYIKTSLVTCLDVIISKKISIYVSCVAINTSADMKAFSLLGILNNFSVFQLIQSINGDNWSKDVIQKIQEIESCPTTSYTSSSDFLYSKIMVDSNVSEEGKYNKVYLASLVQAFTICNFEVNQEGFLKCKHFLKYITDLGINAKTRYIWNKLNTAKMVGKRDSNVIANEFISTIKDCENNDENYLSSITDDEKNNDENQFISITNEHDVRIRFFVGKEKSFTKCLPISITPQNEIFIKSKGASELFLNIEVYHPSEPVDLEISYGDNKHKWYIPYGVSLIEGDVKYLMLVHEKYKESSGYSDEEKMFNFIVKAVPSSMTIKDDLSRDEVDEVDDYSFCDSKHTNVNKQRSNTFRLNRVKPDSPAFCLSNFCLSNNIGLSDNTFASKTFGLSNKTFASKEALASVAFDSKAFATTSKETRKIDVIERKNTFSLNTQILCFSFIFVSDTFCFETTRLSDIIYITKECVICLTDNSTIKLTCNHKCFCSTCYDYFITNNNDHKCPLCRQQIVFNLIP